MRSRAETLRNTGLISLAFIGATIFVGNRAIEEMGRFEEHEAAESILPYINQSRRLLDDPQNAYTFSTGVNPAFDITFKGDDPNGPRDLLKTAVSEIAGPSFGLFSKTADITAETIEELDDADTSKEREGILGDATEEILMIREQNDSNPAVSGATMLGAILGVAASVGGIRKTFLAYVDLRKERKHKKQIRTTT